MIHWELYRRLKINLIENDTHKILYDFEIQTDELISTRSPDFVLSNKPKKKKTYFVDFAVPAYKYWTSPVN